MGFYIFDDTSKLHLSTYVMEGGMYIHTQKLKCEDFKKCLSFSLCFAQIESSG